MMKKSRTGTNSRRTKLFTLAILAAMSVSLFAGCGSASAGTGSGSRTGTGGEVSVVPETPEAGGMPESGNEHDSAGDATPGAAAKQSYFEEHGVQVADAPVSCTVDAVIFDYFDIETQLVRDITWKQTGCTEEAAEEEGYRLIRLDLTGAIELFSDTQNYTEYNFCFFDTYIYDWYTGQAFPRREMSQGDKFEYGVTVEVDGVQYDVSYAKDSEWEYDDWTRDENGNGIKHGTGHYVYTFKVPDGYNGLVFAAVPRNQYTGQDTEITEEEESYALDENYVEGTVFFRIRPTD